MNVQIETAESAKDSWTIFSTEFLFHLYEADINKNEVRLEREKSTIVVWISGAIFSQSRPAMEGMREALSIELKRLAPESRLRELFTLLKQMLDTALVSATYKEQAAAAKDETNRKILIAIRDSQDGLRVREIYRLTGVSREGLEERLMMLERLGLIRSGRSLDRSLRAYLQDGAALYLN